MMTNVPFRLSSSAVLAWTLAAMVGTGVAGSAQAATPNGSGAPANRAADATSFYVNLQGMQLQDQDGRRFAPAQLTGRIVLAHFVYTGCSTACPVQTRALADLQRQLPPALRRRVHLLSISIDPLNDTPQALKQFARNMTADLNGWSFVTGKPEQIERMTDRLRLFRPGTDVQRPADHNTALWLIDAQGQLKMRYSGNPPDVPRLLRELGDVAQMR